MPMKFQVPSSKFQVKGFKPYLELGTWNLELGNRPLLLALVALLSCSAVAAASLRHTGSVAFPIDDGYIYSNYVLAGAQGHFFTYNPGETSGGITGLGWYILCILSYWLLSPLHGLLGGLGPPIARADPELSRQAVHLSLSAYLPGVLCLAATAIGAYRLAAIPPAPPPKHPRPRQAF